MYEWGTDIIILLFDMLFFYPYPFLWITLRKQPCLDFI